MNQDLLLLHVIVRLSRSRSFVDLDAVAVRAGTGFDDARAAVSRLSSAGLAERTPRGIRPTLGGLAIAVASAKIVAEQRRSRRARTVARPRLPRPNRTRAA